MSLRSITSMCLPMIFSTRTTSEVILRPRIVAYPAWDWRIPFNEWSIFRHYKELDG